MTPKATAIRDVARVMVPLVAEAAVVLATPIDFFLRRRPSSAFKWLAQAKRLAKARQI